MKEQEVMTLKKHHNKIKSTFTNDATTIWMLSGAGQINLSLKVTKFVNYWPSIKNIQSHSLNIFIM